MKKKESIFYVAMKVFLFVSVIFSLTYIFMKKFVL